MKPKKLLSFILATAMAISLLPTFTLTASATTTTEKKITLGTSALSGYDSTNGYKYVYYGAYTQNEYTPTTEPASPVENTVYEDTDTDKTQFVYHNSKYYRYEPIKWRILSINGNDGTYKDGNGNNVTSANAMFLLSEYALKQMAYELAWNTDDDDGQTYPSDWRFSDAWNWCNDTTDSTSFIYSSFTDSEKAYFLKTSKDNTRSPYTDELKGDTFFFLSYAEANQIYTESRDLVAKMSNASGNAARWWLRSPDLDDYVDCVDGGGSIIFYFVGSTFPAARPAFNLNLSSVLFTSAANGGKSSTAAAGGGAEISKNADYTISGDEKYEYKLTMLDTSRSFEVTEESASGTKGDTITFNYENAETGSNEYISAMIVDDSDEVLYYGQGEKTETSTNADGTSNGTVNFKIPSDINYGTYELRLFNEQINGDCKTDYSSDFRTIPLSVKKTPSASDFKFTEPNNLTYDGNVKTATVTSSQNGMGTVTVKYYNENGTKLENAPTDVGKYTVKIDIAEGTDYLAKTDLTDESWTFAISAKDITRAIITLGDSLTYDGTEQTQTISKVEVDSLTLTENTDYEILSNSNKGTEAKDDYELTISGIGNFTGTATKQFAIAKANSQTTAADTTVTYGDKLTLTATVEKSNARTLNTVDFYVGEGDDAEPLGTANVTYTDGTHGKATFEVYTTQKQLQIGKNKITAEYGGSVNLNGSKSDTITVTLNEKEIGLSWNGYATRDYNGQPSNVTATATGTLGNDEIGVTVTGGNETNANTYTATATGLTGTYAEYYILPTVVTQDYTISPKNISGADVGAFAEMTYNGHEQTPSATVTIDGLTATGEWSKVTNVSDKTTFTANGNFTGEILDVTPNMAKKSIDNATLALDGELTYNGQKQMQQVTVTLDGFTNVTFDISDNEQTDVKTEGDYTLTITANGNFEGTKTLDWNINPYTPKENPDKKTTARVKRNRTLAEATVTNGEMLGIDGVTALEGTFAWADDTKTMSADGTEQMTFTPTDTNYATVTVVVAVSIYSSSGGGSSVTRYTVKFDTDGGSTIANQTVTKNSKATEPTKPTKEGYIFDGWYTDSEFTTEYDFTAKVTKNITLYAKWVEDEIQEPSDDKKDDEPQTDEWKNPFDDVKENDWYFDNVKYANENGLMSGVTNSTFAPNNTLTRAMLVTVLWRAEGEPNVDFAMPFTDVADTAYYAEAVRWAASENIVNGVTAMEFAPDMNITREQIATIIYRYAKYKGYDVSVGEDTNILSYADFDEISEYAIEAMQYAVGSGLMKGKTETTLNPKDNATRAEIAAILNRFIETNK